MNQTGLAFSGGGIRSAALCSGVLRRLLQHKIRADYLSCVSGGGYTGTAYLDWKYRNEQKDDSKWHQQFFDHMRQKAGVFCNWQKPLEGIFDAVLLLFLSLFVAVVLPVFIWFSLAFPTAYIVDLLFGDLMRASFLCPQLESHNFTSKDITENPAVNVLYNMTDEIECVPMFGPRMYYTFMTFISLFIAFLLLFLLKKTVGLTLSPLVRLLCNASGFAFAMVFLPWLIEEYIVVTPMWLNALVIVVSVFLWLGLPPLRDKASLALIVYLYAYTVKWRVYKTSVLHIEYTPARFTVLMWISGILVWLNPLLGLFQRNAVHVYNR